MDVTSTLGQGEALQILHRLEEGFERLSQLLEGSSSPAKAADGDSAERFERIVESLLPDAEIPSPAALLQARRNAEARWGVAREFGLLTAPEVAELAGSQASNRSALASRWKAEGRIWSVPFKGQQLWPGFQFDKDGQPRPVIAEVWAAFPEEASPWERTLWFVSANGLLGGERPVDLLDLRPEDVLDAARRESEELFT